MIKTILKNLKLNIKLNKDSISLLYHYVSDVIPVDRNLHAVDTLNFIKAINYFLKKGKFVSTEEYFALLKANKSVKNIFTLTFDDGYKESLKTILPILEDMQVPSTFFINSSMAQGENFWRDDLRWVIENDLSSDFIDFCGFNKILNPNNIYTESKNPNVISSKLIRNGLCDFFKKNNIEVSLKYPFLNEEDFQLIKDSSYLKVGNHSVNHYLLSTLKYQEQFEEIENSKIFLDNYFHQDRISKVFSVPFGGFNTYNEDTIEILRKMNYEGMYITESNSYLKSNSKNIVYYDDFPAVKRFLPKNYMRFYL